MNTYDENVRSKRKCQSKVQTKLWVASGAIRFLETGARRFWSIFGEDQGILIVGMYAKVILDVEIDWSTIPCTSIALRATR